VRVALLSYRSKPHCGGQGVYVRHLSRELVRLGHEVEVFSGQPYPELDEGVRLTRVPSLDLYREPDPFRTPRLRELRDLVDNQSLGYALLGLEAATDLPLVVSVHHPISIDRRIDLESAATWRKRLSVRRWYAFVRMQARVARAMRMVLVPSESSRRDVVHEFGVAVERVRVVLLGVDDGFVPPSEPRVPGRILAMASADAPSKGISTLLEAFAKLRTERPELELVLVTRPVVGGRTDQLLDALAIRDHVRFVHGVSDAGLVTLMGSAEVACVPSLYEGFSLPTAELMATATPLVVSRAGAIPEVVGPDGLCADLVTPGDVGELASALAALLDDPERRARYGAAGRRRVEELFSWRAVAAATAAAYADAAAEKGRARPPRRSRAHR
jgi:glycosyltransferase involved in cell wall biosynthesis